MESYSIKYLSQCLLTSLAAGYTTRSRCCSVQVVTKD